MIESNHKQITVKRQCEILGIARSSAYYKSRRDTSLDEEMMRAIDKQYIRAPFYGVPRMTVYLRRIGYDVGEHRVRRLLRMMGIIAIYPKKRLSVPDKLHEKYPYLLRGVKITEPNQVWCTDITYIPMEKGFLYLVAVMDWATRYIISWELSVSLEASFCVKALKRALSTGKPDIFNSDQGSQFTSDDFIGRLKDAGVRISMDGRGRAYDNIFIERLWRSLKYEEVYSNSYESVSEARRRIGKYIEFYNNERYHQSLGYRTPAEVYFGDCRRVPFGYGEASPTSFVMDPFSPLRQSARPAPLPCEPLDGLFSGADSRIRSVKSKKPEAESSLSFHSSEKLERIGNKFSKELENCAGFSTLKLLKSCPTRSE